MAVKVFMLIEADVGKTGEVVDAVQKTEGVKSADSVTGPYDVVATVEVPELEEIGRVARQIHSVAGMQYSNDLFSIFQFGVLCNLNFRAVALGNPASYNY